MQKVDNLSCRGDYAAGLKFCSAGSCCEFREQFLPSNREVLGLSFLLKTFFSLHFAVEYESRSSGI
jgi:hypothetical protein